MAMSVSSFNGALVVPTTFVSGMRELGYRHTGAALAEMIDNALDADARNIHVVLKPDAQPEALAVLDDGNGIAPDMLSHAIAWGGTHRDAEGRGFGRFGFGLPSAAVSQGRRLSVYSSMANGTFSKSVLDLDQVAAIEVEGKPAPPAPLRGTLPDWVQSYMARHSKRLGGGLDHGTVVVIETLDRLTWRTPSTLVRNLLQHFGVTYRHYLRMVDIWVDGRLVSPVDPLFLMPTGRFYDIDDDRAVPMEPLAVEVKDHGSRTVLEVIKVRFSYLPPTFATRDKESQTGGGRANPRSEIMKEHNGMIFLRNGRQIDVVSTCPWLAFGSEDRFWKVEVDFPSALDSEFGLTSTKQRVAPSPRVWELLRGAGVPAMVQDLRRRRVEDLAAIRARANKSIGPRPSEVAMTATEPHRIPKPGRIADLAPLSTYAVAWERRPGSPFYRTEKEGVRTVLHLNVAHRFFTDVYAGLDSTHHLRAALEVLLFAIGCGEVESQPNRQRFYSAERAAWSEVLRVALSQLEAILSADNALTSAIEMDEGHSPH